MEATSKALTALAAAVVLGALAASVGGVELAWVGAPVAALLLSAALIARDPRRGALATAVVCALSNAYLLQHKCAAAGTSICNVNAVINCDAVNNSAASMAFGLPITLYGLAFYTGLAIAAALAGRTPQGPGTPESARFDQVNVFFAAINLGYSAWLAWQASLIGAVCLICMTIYLGNALLMWSGVAALRRQAMGPLEAPAGLPVSAAFATIATTFLVITLIGSSGWQRCLVEIDLAAITRPAPVPVENGGSETPVETQTPESDIAVLYHLPRGQVITTGEEPRTGSTDPKYILLEFADFACPHCALASKEMEDVLAREKDLQLRFRVFPLTASCNPALEQDSGPERCFAAMAAFCGGQQGKYFELSHLLFANQPAFEPENLTIMAQQVGLDLDRWNECMQGPAASAAIQADAVAGAQAQIFGTPSFFLLGTHGDQWIEVPMLDVVPQLLAAHRSGVPLPPPPPAPAEPR